MVRVPDTPDPPWRDEPNEKHWEAHGLQCAIYRNGVGALCGYVGVPAEHPLYGVKYSDEVPNPPKQQLERPADVDKVGVLNVLAHLVKEDDSWDLAMLLDCHKGLTFSGGFQPDYDQKELWWFGFDCAHAGDLAPGLLHGEGDVYRDMSYVIAETENLAKQLAEWDHDVKEKDDD